jgi:TonB family protein
MQGQVVLDVTISPEGGVTGVEVVRGNPTLTEAARAAVKKWKYQPYLLGGKPTEVMTPVRVNFTLGKVLDRGPAPPEADYKEAAKRVRVSLSEGNLLHEVWPIYPEEAKRRGITGTVVLKGIVDRNGNLAELRVESGHPMLVQAAVGAVEQWRYQPYLLDGAPVEVETQITVNFVFGTPPSPH